MRADDLPIWDGLILTSLLHGVRFSTIQISELEATAQTQMLLLLEFSGFLREILVTFSP